MMTAPLRSWLLSLPRNDVTRAAEILTNRATAQGVHLLVTEDPWFMRARVEEATARLAQEWKRAHPNGEPIPDGWLPIFRQGVDPCFGMRAFVGILGVIPDMPMTLLTTNAAVLHARVTPRWLIESQHLWSDDPEKDRAGIAVELESDHPEIGPIHDIAHSGSMWVTPSMRGKRYDGLPLAAHLAPLMRLCAFLHLAPSLVIGTVADGRLTRTFGSRIDGEIHVTQNGETATQALHVYTPDDIAASAADVLKGDQ